MKFAIRPSLYNRSYRIHLFKEDGKELRFIEPFEIKLGESFDPDSCFNLPSEPTLILSHSEIMSLKECVKSEFGHLGLMPNDHGASEQMKTMKNHLDDMKMIAHGQNATLMTALLNLTGPK